MHIQTVHAFCITGLGPWLGPQSHFLFRTFFRRLTHQSTKKSLGMTFASTRFRVCVRRMFRQFSLSVDGGPPKTAGVSPHS